MSRMYATRQAVFDLTGVDVGDTPEGERTLRRASGDVDTILRGARYAVDTAGMPTESHVTALLAEMVCEQVLWYQELGDETGIAAAAGGGSIGKVTLPRVGASASAPAQLPGQGTLAPRAIQLAMNAGLSRHPGY